MPHPPLTTRGPRPGSLPSPDPQRHHYWHATGTTNQSQSALSRTPHLGSAWANPQKGKGFSDLVQGLPEELFSRITPLYIHKNQRTPDAPSSEPHLKQRQRDAALAAWERANAIHDQHAEAWQRTLDQDHLEVYKHAAARLEKIFKDPQYEERATPPSSTRRG